jgi:predicted alpha/beta hydrolase family esterase
MNKAKYVMVPFAAALIAGAAACGTVHSTVPPQAKASIQGLANVPGADAQSILIRAGVPIHGTPAQQIAFGKAMLVKANRQALAQKLAIPAQNKSAFQAAVLGAAEHGHLSTHQGRVTFFDVTFPNLVKQYQ